MCDRVVEMNCYGVRGRPANSILTVPRPESHTCLEQGAFRCEGWTKVVTLWSPGTFPTAKWKSERWSALCAWAAIAILRTVQILVRKKVPKILPTETGGGSCRRPTWREAGVPLQLPSTYSMSMPEGSAGSSSKGHPRDQDSWWFSKVGFKLARPPQGIPIHFIFLSWL